MDQSVQLCSEATWEAHASTSTLNHSSCIRTYKSRANLKPKQIIIEVSGNLLGIMAKSSMWQLKLNSLNLSQQFAVNL